MVCCVLQYRSLYSALEVQKTASGGRGARENTQTRGGIMKTTLNKIKIIVIIIIVIILPEEEGRKVRRFILGKRHSLWNH